MKGSKERKREVERSREVTKERTRVFACVR